MVTSEAPGLSARAGSVAVGLALAQLLPEPPNRYHPVAWFGDALQRVEARRYRDDRRRGIEYVVSGVALAIVGGLLTRRLVGPRAAAALATTVTVGGRMLTLEATAVGTALSAGDLGAARDRLPSLVGRDPSDLGADDIARAVVESVAENTVDALVAPVLWGAVAGGPGALFYRAANTMDAMVGHHSPRYERYGWAAARLDDLVNWPAARLCAAIVALLRPRRAKAVWRAVRADAPEHPSPNAGVVEAAFAAALDLRLGGVNRYGDRVEERARLGTGRPPVATDIGAAVALSRQIARVLLAALITVAIAPYVVRLVRGR